MRSDTPPSSSNSTPPSDFRTAVIKNHWNDPPKKSVNNSDDALEVKDISGVFSSKLELCKTTFETGPQKRVVDDTARRINILLQELEKGELPKEVIRSLHTLTDALESKEYTKALEVYTQLMTTEYERHGNWITGIKRLVDLTEKASS
ncbi:unnamed protein product [Mucor hiemalis]